MPSSLFRSWRKKDHQQTQASVTVIEVPSTPRSSSSSSSVSPRITPHRRPSDTPSIGSSSRFHWPFHKGSHAETDCSSVASMEDTPPPTPSPSPPRIQHPPKERLVAFASPHPVERPLPPLPPMRPPRPPSLNLNAVSSSHTAQQPCRPSQRRPPILEHHSDPIPRRLPVLDNVWEGFMRDVESSADDIEDFAVYGISNCSQYASQEAAEVCRRTPKMRPPLYRNAASESTPHLPSLYELSDSESDDGSRQNDCAFPLSQFPSPPPMPRRRTAPTPLVLLPTPTIAPLPPSPLYSSGDSTPVATPTTPRHAEHCLKKGILKSPSSPYSSSSSSVAIAAPVTPSSPPRSRAAAAPKEHSHPPPPRLRSAQSVPHFHHQALTTHNIHRLTSSDTASPTHRRRVTSRPDAHIAQQFYAKAPLPALPANVQWGYAV
ncbi:hypothetical protein R3P38DRAFT_666389 [Favolaschia claudopus]|uniref:Uncharacterized protein n=1 Tax=Favolaschia claudopus TaxID=2862362 RepID=A0AAW0EBE4_9AGAR